MMKKRRDFIKAMGLSSAGLLIGGKATLGAKTAQDVPEVVIEVRKAARHFAMLYFHFCKNLVDTIGEEQAFPVVQKTIFELSIDRSDRIRAKALSLGLEPTLANFPKVNDLATPGWEGWRPVMGGHRCIYADVWLERFDEYPWFKRFASLYCDVIDTTNIENFSRTTSHRITSNLLWGDSACNREFFESEQVKKGIFTYGKRDS